MWARGASKGGSPFWLLRAILGLRSDFSALRVGWCGLMLKIENTGLFGAFIDTAFVDNAHSNELGMR